MHKLIFYIILFGIVVNVCQNVKLSIKKCCPTGQYLDSSLSCSYTSDTSEEKIKFKYDASEQLKDVKETHLPDISFKNQINSSNDFENSYSWFPFSSILNSSTLEPITNIAEVEEIINEANFEYGRPPDCDIDDMDTACFRKEVVSQFLLILYQDEIKLYVAKKSSYHDEDFFRVESRSCSANNNATDVISIKDPKDFSMNNLRTFSLEDACFDNGPRGYHTVVYCPCKTTVCVRKCCGENEIYDDVIGSCVSNNHYVTKWRPYVENNSLDKSYYLMSGTYPSTCDKPHLLKIPLTGINSSEYCFSPDSISQRNSFTFLSDGSVQVAKYKFPIQPMSYCGEHTVHNGNIVVENNLFICINPKDLRPLKFDIYGIIMLLGGVVLLITVAISLYLPELRTSVYYKIIICHNVSLMIASFTWGTANLLPSITYSICVFLSLVIQFTFIGSFFWMNIMCIDISLAFRRVRATVNSSTSKRRFLWYSIYACGVPIIITCITAAMEFAPNVPSYHLRPGFGCHNCGFNSESSAILIYFYGPMIVILLFNLVLFILTIIRIVQVQSQTAILNSKGGVKKTNAFNSDKQRLILFSKLFLLMGLTWSMEIVSWAVGGPSYYWYIPDFINFLRAFFIFVIFICKKTVICSLLLKLGLDEWADFFSSRRISAASSRLSETSLGRNRKSRYGTNDRYDSAEIERRGRILQKQITQTIRNSDESQL